MLSPPKPLDEIQPNLVCELLPLIGRATAICFAPPPGEGSKIIQIQLQSQFQRFLYQTLCVFSQMKDTNISDGIFILLLGHAPGGILGAGGAQVVKKFNIFIHGHVAYQLDEYDEQNRMQAKFSS